MASLDTIKFLDTYVCCINNPHWQSSGIIFLCKYEIVISYTLIGSSFAVFVLLLDVILSALHEKPRRKDGVTEKSTLKFLCEGHLFDCTPSFLCHFLLLSLFTLFPFPSDILAEWPL